MSKPRLYADGGNLYLKVDEGGAKSWIYRRKVRSKIKKLGLGPLHTVSLAEARKRRDETRRMLDAGIDPKEAKRAERRAKQIAAAVAEAKTITFDEAAKKYIAAHEAEWKSGKHGGQWAATLKTYASPHLGRLPVSARSASDLSPHLGLTLWLCRLRVAVGSVPVLKRGAT